MRKNKWKLQSKVSFKKTDFEYVSLEIALLHLLHNFLKKNAAS